MARRELLGNRAALRARALVRALARVPEAGARVCDVGLVLVHHVLGHLDQVVEEALDCVEEGRGRGGVSGCSWWW